MSYFTELFQRFLAAYEDDTVRIPCCGLRFVRRDEPDPRDVFAASPQWLDTYHRSLASCGFSYKAAKGGWTLRVTEENIGCPAGAMSLGLVYAPHQSGHPEFALFGEEDCGRYETLQAAQTAVAGMPVIPPVMKAVYYYHPLQSSVEMDPHLVHVYCTPLQAMRMIQGYCFPTGNRFSMSCIGIRGVSCDMTAWPFMHNDINGTFLCLGARAISGWEEEYVGFGMPLHKFEQAVVGMEKSRAGFPYKEFPKMVQIQAASEAREALLV
jgi:uncharacterized protein (DUF169 family)